LSTHAISRCVSINHLVNGETTPKYRRFRPSYDAMIQALVRSDLHTSYFQLDAGPLAQTGIQPLPVLLDSVPESSSVLRQGVSGHST
jgi:hypothetical protein